MRIAGDTIRRNYLSRYETNYTDKYNSEKKIYSGRQFDRASENPINAARALRLRKSMAEVETNQGNLKTADSIYTNAESALMTVSGVIQTVYEKLVEGAHGTRNQDDLNIIAMSIDNYAEEMVQSLNIDIADRKVFGGLNNDTVAFKIEGDGDYKQVTYNGVPVNSSGNPDDFPYSGESYLDIGIGMATDTNIDRIDGQTALPITFNGVKCTGCGVQKQAVSIDLNSIEDGKEYTINVSAGGRSCEITFQGGPDDETTVANINNAIKDNFMTGPEMNENGQFKYIDNPEWYTYKNTPMNTDGTIDFGSVEKDTYYSLEVVMNGVTRHVDFKGGDTVNQSMDSLKTSLDRAFGEGKYDLYASGRIEGANKKFAEVSSYGDYGEVGANADGDVDVASLTTGSTDPDKTYAINLNGKQVIIKPGDTVADTVTQTNKSISTSGLFGDYNIPVVLPTGTVNYPVEGASVSISNASGAENQVDVYQNRGYANNLIQLVLDSAKYLRAGDQDMVARYADLIYAAQSNISMAIADLGTNSKFIEFNTDRLEEVMINLKSKQNDIESTDLPSEITRWKVLESVYNASLQMGSSVLSQTIFNYIN